MSENIIVAFIGASAVIIAAIVALIGNLGKKKSKSEGKTTIKQSVKGNSNVQIGIQNNSSNEKGGNCL